MTGPARLRMRMSDIADIAWVERPVVTMWRKRPAPTGDPFPEPIATDGPEMWFDADQVADYLDATGRGNNPTVKADIAAAAALDTARDTAPGNGAPLSAADFATVTALLALRAIDDEGFADQTRDDVLDRADEADPDDQFIYAELEAAGDRLPALGEYADRLVESCYGPDRAMENLMAQRFRLRHPGHDRVALSTAVLDLAADLVLALADQAGMDRATVVDPTGGGSDLLVAVTERAEERAPTVLTVDSGDPPGRLARRRLRAHGVLGRSFDPDHAPADAVYVARYPAPSDPTMGVTAILDAIDEVALTTSPTDRVVILAPAAVLTDPLRDKADSRSRDALLRTDRLRALVKLPPGLVPARPRQRLALCCLGPGPDLAQRDFVAVGDLPDIRLDARMAAALAVDLAAAMTPGRSAQKHVSRYLHLVQRSELLARRGTLVSGTAGPQPGITTGAELALQVAAGREVLDSPLSPPRIPPIEVVTTSSPPQPVTAGSPAGRALVTVRRGYRLAPEVFDEHGSVRVVGLPEVAPGTPAPRRADRLELAARHPAARFTEPGDVVFVTIPRPAAIVDPGGAVVESPARILRAAPDMAAVVPELLAADINALPADAKDWRTWPVRRVPPSSAADVAGVFADLQRYRVELADRIDRLDHTTRALADGLTAGVLALSEPAATTRTTERNTTDAAAH